MPAITQLSSAAANNSVGVTVDSKLGCACNALQDVATGLLSGAWQRYCRERWRQGR